jgi:FAD/FMN-containing dehydrogenase
MDQLAEIVGAGNVRHDPETLGRFSKDTSFSAPLRPWFVVRPADSAQIQSLVKWAIATKTPLVPVSSGGPHGYGDTVPSVAEAVMVDLSCMNAIKKIDRRNRIAVIEPGVTYEQLVPALAKEGLRIPRPLQARPNKSVVASLLERQPTTIPRLNFSLPEPLRNCGVVWGTGEIAYTGEAGSGPLSLDEQWARGLSQVAPTGPSSTDLMRLVTGAQGTMGIVIWASVKLELMPAVRKFFLVPGAKLSGLIDFVYKLTKVRLGDEVFLLNNMRLAELVERRTTYRTALRAALPEWSLFIGLAGAALFPEARLEVQEKELRALAKAFSLELCDGYPGVSPGDVMRIADDFANPADIAHQDIFFLTTLDKVPGFAATVCAVCRKHGYAPRDIAAYIQPQHQGVAHHVEFRLSYDPEDSVQAAKVKAVYYEASEALAAQGAYFSRPYGYWSELVYGRDHTSTEILRTVKGILDPANILNPGKLCF